MGHSIGKLKLLAKNTVIYMLLSEVIAVSIALILFNIFTPGFAYKFIPISKFNNLIDYSKFIVNVLPEYIDTEFCFNVHHDGFIINADKWTDDFLKYDWIGAPWKKDAHFLYNGERVGNGGVSIRSKKLMDIAKQDNCDNHEDSFICSSLRSTLIDKGIKFAPLELAGKFGIECGSEDLNITFD